MVKENIYLKTARHFTRLRSTSNSKFIHMTAFSTMAYFEDAQSVFFEDADLGFYDDAPSPSDEIWKKFELLPTPPRTPPHGCIERDKPTLEESVSETCRGGESFLTRTCVHEPFCGVCDGNLKSKLIQDCMWSAGNGFHFDGDKSSVNAVKSAKESGTSAVTGTKKLPPALPKATVPSETATPVDIPSSECVDPVAVFPYPVNKQTSHSTETSDSEDDEIDVVTVSTSDRSRHQASPAPRRTILPASSSMSAQVAAMHNYSSSRASVVMKSAPQSPVHHNHRVKRAYMSTPNSPQPIVKRCRSGVNEAELRFAVQKLEMGQANSYYENCGSTGSSRPSSDSEDNEGKRAQHNVLERKRRNDLKYSFLRLRDAVPTIATQDKAAKVAILRGAVDHMAELQHRHRTLVAELERQQSLHEQLKKRFSRCSE